MLPYPIAVRIRYIRRSILAPAPHSNESGTSEDEEIRDCLTRVNYSLRAVFIQLDSLFISCASLERLLDDNQVSEMHDDSLTAVKGTA